MVDIDHVADPRALWKELMDKGLKSSNPVFGFVTPSGSGLKIVMPTDVSRGNLASHQAAFAKEYICVVGAEGKIKENEGLFDKVLNLV